jgi:peptide/nickel transport system substrate-binding protein
MGERQGSSAVQLVAKNLANRLRLAGKSIGFARTIGSGGLAARNFDRSVFWPTSQVLTRQTRFVLFFVAVALTAACSRSGASGSGGSAAAALRHGGAIVASIRTDPRSFNRLVARDSSTVLVADLTQAKLVRINQVTQQVEPWLAESWTTSPDRRQTTLKLRRDVQFSDGHPFTADDVVFTFDAVYDEAHGSVLGSALQVGGKPLRVAALDSHTVTITFPQPFAPGVRLLDNLPILPRHKLQPALAAGTFRTAWGLSTPLGEIVGLGPFVLAQYVPGQRLVFDRNPRFFRKTNDGATLPYLDRITIEIIPDQNAEVLRLDAGQLDTTASEIPIDAYAPLKRSADAGRVRLLDMGVAYNADGLWFNLKAGALGADPRAAWLQRDELRRAIAMAVDRQLFANTVFLGAAVPVYGPETPANKEWYWADEPKIPYDPGGAKRLLAAIGIVDRNGDGVLDDPHGQPARFTILTQKGRPNLERAAVVVRDELQKIGLGVDIATLDGGALIERLLSAKYDAIYFNADKSDGDPALNPDFWFSSGSAHPWNIGQPTPATAWERQLDDLMARQIASPDLNERKGLYVEMQKIFAEHLPIVYFVAPRVYVAASSRLTNLMPAVWRPQLLWAADTLAVTR